MCVCGGQPVEGEVSLEGVQHYIVMWHHNMITWWWSCDVTAEGARPLRQGSVWAYTCLQRHHCHVNWKSNVWDCSPLSRLCMATNGGLFPVKSQTRREFKTSTTVLISVLGFFTRPPCINSLQLRIFWLTFCRVHVADGRHGLHQRVWHQNGPGSSAQNTGTLPAAQHSLRHNDSGWASGVLCQGVLRANVFGFVFWRKEVNRHKRGQKVHTCIIYGFFSWRG